MASIENGKLPWFDAKGKSKAPFMIAIAGGTASGKTSVSERIIKNLNVPWVSLLCMDSYYNPLNPEDIEKAHQNAFNFDHPDAFDHTMLFETLLSLKRGEKVEVPQYDFASHSRLSTTVSVYGASVVIFEGMFALYDKRIRDMMDIKIFVDTDADVRLGRRLRRDIAERGRDVEGVLNQYQRFVKPSFDDFIQPTKKHADIIIPRGLDNTVAIDLITKHVQMQLDVRGLELRTMLSSTDLCEPSDHVLLIPQSSAVQQFQLDLRSPTTTHPIFKSSADKLSKLVVEAGLNLLGPNSNESLYCVNVVRGGCCLEGQLELEYPKTLMKGSIEIDSSPQDPILNYFELPLLKSDSYVFICDDQISTGATALMALRIVLDHFVKPEKIIFLTLLASGLGLTNLHNAFPGIKVIVGEISEFSRTSRPPISGRYFLD